MPKILMIIAPENFRDEEYFIPKEVFEKHGYEVVTASKDTKEAVGKLGETTKVDVDYSTQKPEDYDAIVFIGGGGALIYEHNQKAKELVLKAFEKRKIIAAICIAPRILASSGILKNRKVTMWNGDGEQQKIIEQAGGKFADEPVVIDENIITANGPAAAEKFAEELVKKLNQ